MPLLVISISVSSNGNSPGIKMMGGMMLDMEKERNSHHTKLPIGITRNSQDKSRTRRLNHTMLSLNERYRRLIPYMTFYYANDGIVTTTADPINEIEIEVEKAQIIEAPIPTRAAKKIVQSTYRNIPRYQGNRLTQHNIASSNPPRIVERIPAFHYSSKVTPNYNPLIIDQKFPPGQIRFPEQPDIRIQDTPLYIPPRPPLVNLYESDDNPNVRYYYSEKDPIDTFKLIPYEQTPVQVVTENINLYNGPKHIQNIPNVSPTEQVYLKPRPNRPQHLYDLVPERQPFIKKPVLTVSDDYYNRPQPAKFELKTAPVVETGFKPIVPQIPVQTTESTFLSTTTLRPVFEDDHPVLLETVTVAPEIPISYKVPNYYQYVVDNPQNTEVSRDSSTLSEILSILQKSKSLPKPVTRENLGSSIRTLLQVLSELKAAPYSEAELPVLSTAKPFAAPPTPAVEASTKPATEVASNEEHRQEFHKEPYLATVNPPSQHLDDYPAGVVTSQKFPLPIQSDDEGGTPGRPGVDYPTLTIIPQTRFNCKTQRYKGFFADPETRCQVWHYCDLNGGQASFLCPNGTIFSQAGLTCDWWFNVRCASTAQLYVLNESLYKYILPHSPKFPEDYSGPLVDKYLTLKFKEMEEQFRKNKSKQTASEKMATNTDGDTSSEETGAGTTEAAEASSSSDASAAKAPDAVSEASVVVDNPGSSGKVERLHE